MLKTTYKSIPLALHTIIHKLILEDPVLNGAMTLKVKDHGENQGQMLKITYKSIYWTLYLHKIIH